MVFNKFIIIFILILAALNSLSAQGINDTINFKARVFYYFSEKPAAGALIRTSVDSTSSDINGFFQIRVSKRDTVFVGIEGFKTIKAPIRKFGNIESFYLKEDEKTMLDEVIVSKRREHYLMKFVPQDTIRFYRVDPKKDTLMWGRDRNYMANAPMGGGMISELAAQFSKKEQERRKYLDVVAEETLSSTYWKVVGDPAIQKEFMYRYGITENEFIDYKIFFHETNIGLRYESNKDKIHKAFFDQYITFIRYYKY